jgi:hypothetical protein
MKAIEPAHDYAMSSDLAVAHNDNLEEEARPRQVHRKARGGGESVEPASENIGFADAIVARAAKGSGQSLPGELRGQFEQSLGTDLGGVRVHTGPDAAAAAQALDARAYAVGQDVFMGAGEYDPSSAQGQFLLAHEVAHTVQQRGASMGPQFKLQVSQPGDAMETAADEAASAMVSGRSATVGSAALGIHRTPHGHGHEAATPMTPPQQAALTQVEHGGAALSHHSTDDLLALARTLGAAHASQHGDERGRVARALVRLYDAMDAHLAEEFEQGRSDGQMAFEFSEFSMIDVWEIDAHAPRTRRHRPRRAARPRQATVQQQQQQAQPPAAPPPTAQAAPDVAGAMGETEGPHVGEHGASHTLHVVAQGAEVAEAGIELAEIFGLIAHGAPWAMAGTLIAGGVAAIVGPIAQLIAGDEFAAACHRSTGVVRSFCIAFADAVRGQPVHGDGAQVGRQTRATLLARGATEDQLRRLDGLALYRECWNHIHQQVVDQLVEMQRGGFMGTHMGETNAVPNARGIAEYWVNRSRL